MSPQSFKWVALTWQGWDGTRLIAQAMAARHHAPLAPVEWYYMPATTASQPVWEDSLLFTLQVGCAAIKHQISASLALCEGNPQDSPHIGPVMQKTFVSLLWCHHFMMSSCISPAGWLCSYQGGQGSLRHRARVAAGGTRSRLRQRRQQGAGGNCHQVGERLHHAKWAQVSGFPCQRIVLLIPVWYDVMTNIENPWMN